MSRKNYLATVALLLSLAACNLPGLPVPAQETPVLPTVTLPPTPALVPAALPQIVAFTMLDAAAGWAVASNAVVRTADGGLTWGIATPPGATIAGETVSAYFHDALQAWVLLPTPDFATGTLYVTSDGGHAWTGYPAPFGGAEMQFFDQQTGIALVSLGAGAGSEAVALYSTTNGGAGWTLVFTNDPSIPGSSDTLPLSGQKTAIGFRHSSEGFIGGSIPMTDTFYLYQTQDAGVTWYPRSLPWPEGRAGYFSGVEEVEFTSDLDGYIVVSLSGEFLENYIYRTNDGGQTWTQIAGMIPRARHFTVLPGPVFFCMRDNGRIDYTPDGVLWYEVTPDTAFGEDLRDMQFVDAAAGFALTMDAAGHAAFHVTHDSGATWTALIP